MKIVILEIHNNRSVDYKYVSCPKYRDDVEAVYPQYAYPPMMVCKEILENNKISEKEFEMIATPEITKDFTGMDLYDYISDNEYSHFKFTKQTLLSFEAYEIEIEHGECPYFGKLGIKTEMGDRLLLPKIDYPKNAKKIRFSF